VIDWTREVSMTLFRRNTIRSAGVPVLALCLGLLPACRGGGVGGDQLIIPEGCVVTKADLQGTWVLSHVAANLTCPPGTTLHTTGATTTFNPVTVVRDESLPGFKITAPGLTAEVTDVTCHIVWTYLSSDTNALYECFTTFHPATRTAGGTDAPGHADQVTLNNGAGASCVIPSPYLDSFVVVTGS
jgi:hypothetical protein